MPCWLKTFSDINDNATKDSEPARHLNKHIKIQYRIKDTQSFAKLIKELPTLKEDKEDVSYDIESLFTNIPINDAVDYNTRPNLCSTQIQTNMLQINT